MEKAQLLQAIEEAKAELAKAQEDGALEYEAIQAKIAATRDRIRDSKAYCIAQDMASGVKYDLDGPDSVIYHAAMITLAKAVGVDRVIKNLRDTASILEDSKDEYMAKIDALYRVVEKNRLRRVDPAYQFPEGYLTIDEAIKRSMRMIVEKCGMKGYSAENWMSTLFEEGKTASEGQAASEYETASEGENGFATEDRTRRHRNSD